ncbi:hypothetical protein [Haematomicrobium sanguinis]|uniref:hypothetical protein n=1 Tax=Haematomicrobium sanguinis TaxID=479106 RepID=UPI00047C4AA2|nr:hypothetical protein [Haematomicrobium sanguinis]
MFAGVARGKERHRFKDGAVLVGSLYYGYVSLIVTGKPGTSRRLNGVLRDKDPQSSACSEPEGSGV